MIYYYVGIEGGNQGMVKATSLEKARKYALNWFGRANVTFVRKATEEEVDWHIAMSGAIHEA
jgi:hypothetical protein